MTTWERWTIETVSERGWGRSVLAACHDDDDDYPGRKAYLDFRNRTSNYQERNDYTEYIYRKSNPNPNQLDLSDQHAYKLFCIRLSSNLMVIWKKMNNAEFVFSKNKGSY